MLDETSLRYLRSVWAVQFGDCDGIQEIGQREIKGLVRAETKGRSKWKAAKREIQQASAKLQKSVGTEDAPTGARAVG